MKPTVTLLTALAVWLDLTAIALGQPPSDRWTLVPELSDEFAGSSLDLTKWDTKLGYPKSRAFAFNNQNISVSGGRLRLTAKKEDYNGKAYTSAFLESKFSDPGNGSYVEVRAKLMDYKANICCAIWEQNFPLTKELNPNPEIDIQEYLLSKHPNRIHSTLHRWPTTPGVHTQDAHQTYDAPAPLSDDFHNYGVERREGMLRFYLDGKAYWEYNVSSMPEFVTMPRHIIFSLEGHAGNPVDSLLPAVLEIEYIRTYKYMGPTAALGFASGTTALTRNVPVVKPSSATPLMSILDRFTAPDVPALGPAEQEVKPLPSTVPAPANLPGKGLAQHPMLYIGEGYNKMFLINEGKIIWTYQTGGGNEYDDVWMLSNGNILFSRMQYVAEITPKKEVVWKYDAPQNTEIHGCQPIGLDKVLFVQNGLPPKLMVVNIKTKQTEITHDLDFIQPPKQSNVHAEFRRIRYTAQGTYLAPYLNMNKVVEYDQDFKEIWKFDVNDLPKGTRFSPWAALRLKNGNTLITNESGRSQLEVSPDKKVIWKWDPNDLPQEYRIPGSQSCTRLANGNTIICSRGTRDKTPQLVEVTPDKKVVWILWNWADLGPATAVQILDDPGIPENPGESEH